MYSRCSGIFTVRDGGENAFPVAARISCAGVVVIACHAAAGVINHAAAPNTYARAASRSSAVIYQTRLNIIWTACYRAAERA